MSHNDIIKNIVSTLDNKKAEDIRVIGIRDLTIIADYFVIANGTSTTHTKSLADEVEFQVKKKLGINPTRVEGHNGGNWIVLDYSEIIVHIFYKDTRDIYSLERLWADGENIEIKQFLD